MKRTSLISLRPKNNYFSRNIFLSIKDKRSLGILPRKEKCLQLAILITEKELSQVNKIMHPRLRKRVSRRSKTGSIF